MTSMKYIEIEAPAELRGCIKFFWHMSSEGPLHTALTSRVNPDGCSDLVVHRADSPVLLLPNSINNQSRIYVVGPQMRSMLFGFSGNVRVIGACLQPGALPSLFNRPAREFCGEIVNLWDLAPTLATSIEDHISGATEKEEITQFAEALKKYYRPASVSSSLVNIAINIIEHSCPSTPISQIAESMSISQRQLERGFDYMIGLSPKLYCRIVRFNRVVRRINGSKRSLSWAELASEHGYYDQAHFVRDFQQFSGTSPGLFELERSGGPMSDLYNTNHQN